MKAALLWISLAASAYAVPEKIILVDGRTLEKVTAVSIDGEKIRIEHSGGVTRLGPEKIAPESFTAIGGRESGQPRNPLISVTRLETLDGKIYSGVRNVRMRPSFISFVHESGAASVRFEKLSEEIRRQCGYDKQIADEFDKARAEAEAAMAKAEHEHEQKQANAKLMAEERQRRQHALWELEFTSYGDDRYWTGGQNGRMLQDAIMTRHLQSAGYSGYEAMQLMNRKRFR